MPRNKWENTYSRLIGASYSHLNKSFRRPKSVFPSLGQISTCKYYLAVFFFLDTFPKLPCPPFLGGFGLPTVRYAISACPSQTSIDQHSSPTARRRLSCYFSCAGHVLNFSSNIRSSSNRLCLSGADPRHCVVTVLSILAVGVHLTVH